MRRPRRSTSYQPRPGAMPPGTYYRPAAQSLTEEAISDPGGGTATAFVRADQNESAEIEIEVGGVEDAETTETDQATQTEDPTQDADHHEPPSWVPWQLGDERDASATRGVGPGGASPARGNQRGVLVLIGVVLVLALMTATGALLLDRARAPESASPPGVSLSNVSAAEETPPVKIPSDAAYTQVKVLSSGELEVRQWIQSEALLFGISVAVPTDPYLTEGVRASRLRVLADGKQVDGPSDVDSSSIAFSFLGSHAVKLTYRLSGVLVRSSSEPSRALARVVSLDLSYEPRRGPTVIDFQGAEVLNLACTDKIASLPAKPCGQRVDGGWQVRSEDPENQFRVMAQLDLS